MKYRKAWGNLLLVIFLILFCIFLLPPVLFIFMPFILGWLLSLFIIPPVDFLEKKLKLSRKAGAALVLLFMLAIVSLLLLCLLNRIGEALWEMIQTMPAVWKEARKDIMIFTAGWESIAKKIPREMVAGVEEIGENLQSQVGTLVGKLSVPTVGAVGSFTGKLPSLVFSCLICLLSCYFFSVEKKQIENLLVKFCPKSWRKKYRHLKQTTIDVMAGYLKAQLKIELRIYLLLTAGLIFLRVKYSYLIALPIAFLDLLPIFGTGTILIPWAIFELLMGEYLIGAGLGALWGISLLVRQLIQPKVLGDSLGMDPLPTLILLYAGYKLAGLAGMIFAVPLGMLSRAMNEAGFFNNLKLSVKILWQGLEGFLCFTEEEEGSALGEEHEEKL